MKMVSAIKALQCVMSPLIFVCINVLAFSVQPFVAHMSREIKQY